MGDTLLVTGGRSQLAESFQRYLRENHPEVFIMSSDIKDIADDAKDIAEDTKDIAEDTKDIAEKHYFQFDLEKDILGADMFGDLPLPTHVLHFGAATDEQFCVSKPERAFNINVRGTSRLLESLSDMDAPLKRFLYISSGGVYGFRSGVLNEDMKIIPDALPSKYLSTKAHAEEVVLSNAKIPCATVVRLFFPYGPRTNRQRVISRLINDIFHGRTIHLHRNGGPRINPIFIDDLNTLLYGIMSSEHLGNRDVVNVAGPDIVSLSAMVTMISGILHRRPILERTRPEIDDMIASTKKLKSIVPQFEFTPLYEGLRRTIADLLGENIALEMSQTGQAP